MSLVVDVTRNACLALLHDASAKARQKTNAVGLLQAALQVEPAHRGALRLMGRAYQMGEGGLDADDTVAVDYFERAADLGTGGFDNRHSTDVNLLLLLFQLLSLRMLCASVSAFSLKIIHASNSAECL